MSDPDENGIMNYVDFVPICTQYAKETFCFNAMIEKQKILQMGLIDSTTHDASLDFDAIELFRTFKKFDRNQNGTLDFGEYTLCL